MKTPLLIVVAGAFLLAGVLIISGCGTPVTVGVSSDYGSASYSEKGGLVLDVDASAIERRLTDPPSVTPEK